jgi:protein-tyrosine phosphatase
MMTLRLTLALLLASLSVAHAEVKDLRCEQTGPTAYKLSYVLTPDTHEVTIYASESADGASGMKLLQTTSESVVTLVTGKSGERVYFFVKPDRGPRREVSIRHLPLQGTPNFRDLGGYETTNGRFVRWGLLYRSGVLTNLTAQDFAYLKPLGIRVVCDFRTTQENADQPEVWIPDAPVHHVSLPIGDGSGKESISSMQQVLALNPSPEQLKEWLTKTYGGFAITNAPQYAQVFKELEEDRLPLLYHCTAGKDRTGVFSAILLLTLGVPEKTVLADYALTNQYFSAGLSAEDSRKMLAHNPGLAKLSPEQRKVLMEADPAYLESALRMIDAKFGSLDNYRRSELGVSDHEVELLRSRLLEY